MFSPPAKRRKRTFTLEEKLDAIDSIAAGEKRATVASVYGTVESTVGTWWQQRDELRAFQGSKKRKTMGGQGRHQSIPFAADLASHMTGLRDEEENLTTYHMLRYMKEHHRPWLDTYMSCKKNAIAAYNSLMRLCQRFAHRHGFTKRVPCYSKQPTPELIETKKKFAIEFWQAYGAYKEYEIYNMDETAVYYDMPPGKIWAVRGGSSKVLKSQKHSARLTAVLTVRADGKKLPLFIIVRGKPGGPIERYELPTYPPGHFYAVQENAWMDETVWAEYVRTCLAPEIDGPSVLLLDNFEAHVSDAGQAVVSEVACCAVAPVPANATAVCQPLDVGLMGPLKMNLRVNWLKETTRAKTAAEKRMAMILRTIESYNAISANTVAGCFKTAIPRPETQ